MAFVEPEKRQGFGERAKQSLSDLCYSKDALLKVVSTDKYGRTVALVSCAGVDVNRAEVERGLAWVHTEYNKDESLPYGVFQGSCRVSHKFYAAISSVGSARSAVSVNCSSRSGDMLT